MFLTPASSGKDAGSVQFASELLPPEKASAGDDAHTNTQGHEGKKAPLSHVQSGRGTLPLIALPWDRSLPQLGTCMVRYLGGNTVFGRQPLWFDTLRRPEPSNTSETPCYFMWDFNKFMQDLFCGDLKSKIESLQKKLDEADALFKENWGANYLAAPLNVQITRVFDVLREEENKYSELINHIFNLQSEKEQLENKVKVLTDTLADRFAIPVIDPVLSGAVQLDPWNYPYPKPSMVSISDNHYETYPYEVWEKIIQRVWPTVNVVQGRYIAEKGDCDNYADTMSSFMGLSFRNSSSKLQGAWLRIGSRGHAFNGFIDDQNKLWLFEPQSGEILGEYRPDSEVYGDLYREIYRFELRN